MGSSPTLIALPRPPRPRRRFLPFLSILPLEVVVYHLFPWLGLRESVNLCLCCHRFYDRIMGPNGPGRDHFSKLPLCVTYLLGRYCAEYGFEVEIALGRRSVFFYTVDIEWRSRDRAPRMSTQREFWKFCLKGSAHPGNANGPFIDPSAIEKGQVVELKVPLAVGTVAYFRSISAVKGPRKFKGSLSMKFQRRHLPGYDYQSGPPSLCLQCSLESHSPLPLLWKSSIGNPNDCLCFSVFKFEDRNGWARFARNPRQTASIPHITSHFEQSLVDETQWRLDHPVAPSAARTRVWLKTFSNFVSLDPLTLSIEVVAQSSDQEFRSIDSKGDMAVRLRYADMDASYCLVGGMGTGGTYSANAVIGILDESDGTMVHKQETKLCWESKIFPGLKTDEQDLLVVTSYRKVGLLRISRSSDDGSFRTSMVTQCEDQGSERHGCAFDNVVLATSSDLSSGVIRVWNVGNGEMRPMPQSTRSHKSVRFVSPVAALGPSCFVSVNPYNIRVWDRRQKDHTRPSLCIEAGSQIRDRWTGSRLEPLVKPVHVQDHHIVVCGFSVNSCWDFRASKGPECRVRLPSNLSCGGVRAIAQVGGFDSQSVRDWKFVTSGSDIVLSWGLNGRVSAIRQIHYMSGTLWTLECGVT